jgi:hypothetical protein
MGERRSHAGVREVRPRLRDGVEGPDPAEIRERDNQRRAPLEAPEAGGQIRLPDLAGLADEGRHRVLGRPGECLGQPVPLPLHQPPEIGGTARRPLDERAKLGRQVAQLLERLRPAFGRKGDRVARDSGREAHGEATPVSGVSWLKTLTQPAPRRAQMEETSIASLSAAPWRVKSAR